MFNWVNWLRGLLRFVGVIWTGQRLGNKRVAERSKGERYLFQKVKNMAFYTVLETITRSAVQELLA